MATIKTRSYGVDVASYQNNNVNYGNAKFAVIKITQSTNYKNPKAQAQIASAKTNNIVPMGYFYAQHGGSVSAAKAEAKYACDTAIAYGLPKGTYIADDWETGSGNVTSGASSDNTNAILAAMEVIKSYGFKPLLYSGAYLLKTKVTTKPIITKYGDCLWVAAYPLGNSLASSSPNFNYFPSMDGVAIWQFTDNWRGLNVDGNINVVELKTETVASSTNKTTHQSTNVSLHPVVKWDVPRVAVVTNGNGAYVYKTSKLDEKASTTLKKMGTAWQVFGEENGAIKVGKDQYFDGRAVYTKSNPIAFNASKHAVAKIVMDSTHALYEPTADSKKAYGFRLNQKVEIVGRKGRFLQLKEKYQGKTVYVTGNRAYIVL